MLDIKHTLRILTVHFLSPQLDEKEALYTGEELESLVNTLGGQVVDRILERHFKPDNKTFVGKISLKQILRRVKRDNIDVIILNATAKPRQIYEIKQTLIEAAPKIEVWDRIDLILQIFDKHAITATAKLQIQLARLRYMGPRIYGMGQVLSQQGGGIGTTGAGETNTELMRRHWRSEIRNITDKLEKISKNQQQQLLRRKKTGIKTVSIVGYTNAGKSSLFNLLTGKNTLVENVLFATLDSNIGKMYLKELQSEVLITDTIGFIRNLPPSLISAFTSTLMESIQADLLLHVIDLSDPEMEIKIGVVTSILEELGKNAKDTIYVFNKIDAGQSINKEELIAKYRKYSPVFISAKTNVGITEVKEHITSHFRLNKKSN